MNFKAVMIALLVCIASVGVVIWMARSEPVEVVAPKAKPDPEKPAAVDEHAPGVETPPEVAETGPYPRAVVDQSTYEFPSMMAEQKGTHTFVIKNEGAVPLHLSRGGSTCKCTVTELKVREVPPGGSADVTVEWTPTTTMERFQQTAKINTNDPENRVLSLTVSGEVQIPIRVSPEVMQVGEIAEDKPTPVTALVTSNVLEAFKILSVQCGEERIQLEIKPISEEKLKELKLTSFKSGYVVEATIPPDMPVGAFNYQIVMKTDVPVSVKNAPKDAPVDTLGLTATLIGRRSGPLTVFAPQWVEDRSVVEAGRVDPLVGKKISLPMYVRNVPEEGFKILEADAPPFIKVTLEPDPKFTGTKKKFLLGLEFPPKSVKGDSGNQSHRVRLKTNHPRAAEFDFTVMFAI